MKSKTLFLTLAIFLALSSAQDCDNPLLGIYNITGEPAPISAANITFCPVLAAGDICCSNETLTIIQANIIGVTNELNQIAAARDNYLVNLYFNYTDQYTLLASQLQNFTTAVSTIQQANPAIGDPLQQQVNLYLNIANNLITDDTLFSQNFVAFQNARTACWTTLLQIQSSAFCLACNPNYETLGVNPDGTVDAGPAVCNAIQTACAPYLFQNLQFNALIQASQTYLRANDTLTWLTLYSTSGVLPQNDTIDTPIIPLTNITQRTVTLPEGCTATACPWQCDNLFSDSFVANTTLAANGAGIIGGADLVDFAPIGVIVIPVEPDLTEEVIEELVQPIEEVVEVIEEVVQVIEEVVQVIEEVVQPVEEEPTLAEVADNLIEEVIETVEEVVEAATPGNNRMLDEHPWAFRFLQDGTWNPALNETGFETPVQTDPGNVSNAEEGGTPEVTPPTTQDGVIVKMTGAVILIVAATLF